MAPKLRCRSGNDEHLENVKDHQMFCLDQEPDKRSSFIFQSCGESSSVSKIQKPCNLIIECLSLPSSDTKNENQSLTWLFGGAEIHSNSRNIEVYAVPEGKGFNEREYWQTYRGSKVESQGREYESDAGKDACEKEVYQTIILPPSSKPTSIQSLYFKLLSLRPAKCNTAFVQAIKLKGRLPDIDRITSASADPSSDVSTTNEHKQGKQIQVQENNTSSGEKSNDSTAQVANAISGLTMMINNVRGSMEASIQSTIGDIQSMAFNQNQILNGKLLAFEKSVAELKGSVDSLNSSVDFLRKENRAQNEEYKQTILQLKNEEGAEKGQEVIESVRELLRQERQWMAIEMKKNKNEMISQIVKDLKSEMNKTPNIHDQIPADDKLSTALDVVQDFDDEIDTDVCNLSVEKCREELPPALEDKTDIPEEDKLPL